MSIVVTVKMKPRYTVRATPDKSPFPNDAEIFDRVTGYRKARRPHQAAYSLLHRVHTAEYLSDRVAGYPVPASLLYMRSEHNEDRRKTSKPVNTGRLRKSLTRR